jgi:hypothetical protein
VTPCHQSSSFKAFNLVLDFWETQQNFGFLLEEEKVIMLPFADNFCLITAKKVVQQ